MKIKAIAASIPVLALTFGVSLQGHLSIVGAAPLKAAGTCQNYQLLIRPYSSQGAAGSDAVIFRLHNLTSRACSLRGYPGVQLLSRQFTTLPTTVHRGAGDLVGAIRVRTVSLPANGNAYFAMGYSDVPVYNQPCPTDYYVMVIAPNDYLPDVTYAFPDGAHTITACSGTLYVSPITATPRFH